MSLLVFVSILVSSMAVVEEVVVEEREAGSFRVYSGDAMQYSAYVAVVRQMTLSPVCKPCLAESEDEIEAMVPRVSRPGM